MQTPCLRFLEAVWWRQKREEFMMTFPFQRGRGGGQKMVRISHLELVTKSRLIWRRKWQATPVSLPGKSHGQRSLVVYSPWGRKELDTTEQLTFTFSQVWGTWVFPSGEPGVSGDFWAKIKCSLNYYNGRNETSKC